MFLFANFHWNGFDGGVGPLRFLPFRLVKKSPFLKKFNENNYRKLGARLNDPTLNSVTRRNFSIKEKSDRKETNKRNMARV